jgi:hypothetical protein
MTVDRKLNLVILQLIRTEYWNDPKFKEYIEEYYDIEKLDDDYVPLLEEFLNKYAK